MDKTNPLAFCGLTFLLSEAFPWSTRVPLPSQAGTKHTSMSVGCVRRRREGHGAGAKAPGDKFLLFHALRPTALGALDERAQALHMALLCPVKTLRRARGISVPSFSLRKYRSLCSLPSAALLSLVKGLMQSWGEAPAWPFSGSCTGMDLQHLHAGPCPGRYLSHRPQPTTTLEAEQEGEQSPRRLCLLLPQLHPLCG